MGAVESSASPTSSKGYLWGRPGGIVGPAARCFAAGRQSRRSCPGGKSRHLVPLLVFQPFGAFQVALPHTRRLRDELSPFSLCHLRRASGHRVDRQLHIAVRVVLSDRPADVQNAVRADPRMKNHALHRRRPFAETAFIERRTEGPFDHILRHGPALCPRHYSPGWSRAVLLGDDMIHLKRKRIELPWGDSHTGRPRSGEVARVAPGSFVTGHHLADRLQ